MTGRIRAQILAAKRAVAAMSPRRRDELQRQYAAAEQEARFISTYRRGS